MRSRSSGRPRTSPNANRRNGPSISWLYYDSLTGSQIASCSRTVSNAISYAARHQQHLATLFIDLDRFQNHQRYARTYGGRHAADPRCGTVERIGRQSDSVVAMPTMNRCTPSPDSAATDSHSPVNVPCRNRKMQGGSPGAFWNRWRTRSSSRDTKILFRPVSAFRSIRPTAPRSKRAPEERRHRDVPCEGTGPEQLPVYSSGLNAAAAERLDLENELRRAWAGRVRRLLSAEAQHPLQKILGAEALVR